MKNDHETDEHLESLYQEYWEVHTSMFAKDNDPLEVAAILIAQGLQIYKTALDEEDYKKMIQSIVDSSDHVKKITEEMGTLH